MGMESIDSLQTYSCDLDSCTMVFSQAYELRRHKIKHEDADR